MLVAAGSRSSVGSGELNRGQDVQCQSYEHGNTEDPDTPAVKHGVKEFSVVIECLRALIDEHVADKVTC